MMVQAGVLGRTVEVTAVDHEWQRILTYAGRYPSPHNSQPIKVAIDGPTLQLFYDLDRGLPAESYGIPFGSVCAGIFIESVAVAAHGFGFELVERLDYSPMRFDSTQRLHRLGSLTLVPTQAAPPDFDPDLMLARRTSRLPYDERLVPADVLARAADEAARHGHQLKVSADPRLVEEIVAVNQRTLFYDLANRAVRHEIRGYLRFNEREALRHGDGLSARCLSLPGPVMRLVLGNYWLWRVPVVGSAIKQVYLRSMRGVRQVGWLKGPFADERDYTVAGRAFFRMWLALTEDHVHLHPFGSVVTNPRAHRELLAVVGEEEDEDMLWMLFRLGYSKEPPVSHRRPLADMVVASS